MFENARRVYHACPTLAAPFALMDDIRRAQLVSNGLALALLFGAGFSLAYQTGENPFSVAYRLLGFGAVLVAVTLALGG